MLYISTLTQYNDMRVLLAIEADHHDAQVVCRVVGKRVFEELLGRLLCVLYAADKIDCVLVFTDIPEL